VHRFVDPFNINLLLLLSVEALITICCCNHLQPAGTHGTAKREKRGNLLVRSITF
jgi:hypothetical protein